MTIQEIKEEIKDRIWFDELKKMPKWLDNENISHYDEYKFSFQEGVNCKAYTDAKIIDEVFAELEEELIEALNIAKQSLEKQIPKKPMMSYDEKVKENWCSCGVCAFSFGWKRTIHYKYCPNCGQAIDWSDTK